MVIRSVTSGICSGRRKRRRHPPSSLPMSPEAPAKQTPAAVLVPFLGRPSGAHAHNLHEMDWGRRRQYSCLIPQESPTPVLKTDHRSPRVLTSWHSEVPRQAWCSCGFWTAGSPPGLASSSALPASPLPTCEVGMLYIHTSENESLILPGRGYNWVPVCVFIFNYFSVVCR